MDKNSIIDRNTFEVCINAEDHKDVFICDKEIENKSKELEEWVKSL